MLIRAQKKLTSFTNDTFSAPNLNNSSRFAKKI